jgi:hypothetical protein
MLFLLILSCSTLWGADAITNSQVRFQVRDATSLQPVSGATVYLLCVRPNPYGTNTYRSGADGWVAFPFYDRACSATVAKDGYASTSVGIPVTNTVVCLTKIPK